MTGYHINRPHPFMFCMSEESDVLSQWRGYAMDGTGVAIGFNALGLPHQSHLPCTIANPLANTALWQVVYDDELQYKTTKTWFQKVMESVECKTVSHYQCVGSALSSLAPLLKNPSFREEKEWRLIHTPQLLTNEDNDHVPIGTNLKMSQQVSRNELMTFFEYSFPIARNEFVREVWLGPKCSVSEFDLSMFLAINGYGNIPIRRSSATYR